MFFMVLFTHILVDYQFLFLLLSYHCGWSCYVSVCCFLVERRIQVQANLPFVPFLPFLFVVGLWCSHEWICGDGWTKVPLDWEEKCF